MINIKPTKRIFELNKELIKSSKKRPTKTAGIIETMIFTKKSFLLKVLFFKISRISFLNTQIVLKAVAKCKTSVINNPLFSK